jgi:hypothetical protein
MIADFEARLVDILGARLPAPFTGRTVLAPGAPPAADVQLVIGVLTATAVEPEFDTRRPEIVPGVADPRRVLRLNCTVGVEIRAAAAADRTQQMRGLDAALYALDAPDFQDGTVLDDGTDRGFLIQSMSASEIGTPDPPVSLTPPRFGFDLSAIGLFWPTGVTGQAGRAIGEIRVRGNTLPIELDPPDPVLVAGGAAAPLTVRVRVAGSMRLTAANTTALPFGQLAVKLISSGGRPGLGTLGGGTAGAAGVRIAPVANDAIAITYTPPATPGIDQLVVALDDGNGGMGIEIGRATLRVRAG